VDFTDPRLRGFRKTDEKLERPDVAVYDCACGCGGHVLAQVQAAEVLAAVRKRVLAEAAMQQVAPCFGGGFYIEEHEPMGIAAAKMRTGKRAFLKANT
jgi:hypothetical protein